MANRLFVASRKGLFCFEATASQWTLTGKSFLGEPVTAITQSASKQYLVAALNLGHFGVKLHRSSDQGQTWEEIDAPSYKGVHSDAQEDDPSLQLVWVLEYDADDTLWAGTLPGGLFKSTDHGSHWSLVESLWQDPLRKEWFGGGYDSPGIHSICFDPRNHEHVALAVSCGGVWISEDGGQHWQVKTKGMKASYMPPDQAENPATQDPHRMVQCAGNPDVLWVQHHCGIFLSEDRGESWRDIKASPSAFGFAVAVHPNKPGTAWFVPAQKDEKRYPVNYEFVVNKTEDYGKTFTTIRAGLPQEDSFDLVYRHALDVSSDGVILAMGSTTGNLWVSENGGDNWQNISNYLPPIYAVRFL
ncbi:hypothetical protein TDB9533_02023 [Thalassocella blandensis]|nr:hypothetical protein TDB9533_02023 [Thalassocella blandensis]